MLYTGTNPNDSLEHGDMLQPNSDISLSDQDSKFFTLLLMKHAATVTASCQIGLRTVDALVTLDTNREAL